MQEPQPALGEGQRQRVGPGHGAECGPCVARVLAQQFGQFGHGLLLEQGAHRQLDAECAADPGHQAGGEQRVPAQGEEAVVDAHLGDAEHLGEHLAQGFFLGVAGCGVRRRRAGLLSFGRGQPAAVGLAAGGQRQCVEEDERGRDHVVGEFLGQCRAQVAAQFVARAEGRAGHHVGDQPLVARLVLANHDDRVLDLFLAHQHRLDLAEFDPVAAQLDLVVESAEVVDGAVRPAPYEVAGAVQAVGEVGVEGVGDELLCRQLWPVDVAAGQSAAADAQFTGDAGRDRSALGVEDVHLGVGDRPADGDRVVHDAGAQGVDGGLAGAVHVPQVHALGQQAAGQVGGQCLAAYQSAQSRAAGPAGVEQHPPGGGGRLHHGRAGGGHLLGQQGAVGGHLAGGEHHAGALDERQQQLQGGDVERQGGDGEEAVVGVDAGPLLHRPEQVAQGPVGQLDALGASGRSGRVDHVGEVLALDGRVEGLGGLGGEFLAQLVHAECGGGGVRQAGQHRALGDQDGQFGVLDHERHAVLGQFRVEGHVGARRLQDGQDGDDHVERAFQADPDHHIASDAEAAQPAGQLVGGRVELAVGEGAALAVHGLGVGSQRRLLLDALVGEQLVGPFVAGVRPFLVLGALLVLGQQRDVQDGLVRVGEHVVQEHLEVAAHAVDGGRVEQLGVVLEPAAELLALLEHLQFEVEACGGALHVHQLQAQPAGAELGHRDVLVDEGHLEDGRAGQVALRAQLLHQPFEGYFLVGEGAEGRAAYPAEELGERRVAGGVVADGERVDEVADEVFDLGLAAVGHRHADDDVLLAAVAVQQRDVGGEQGHERGGAGAPAQLAHAAHHRGGQVEGPGRAGRAEHRGPWPVGGQFEDGCGALEGRLPVLQFGREARSRQLLALPGGVVGVLDGKLRQFGAGAADRALVQGDQLAEQHGGRPQVGDDVVHGEQQDVFVGGQAQELHPHERPGAQVEGAGELPARQCLDAFLAFGAAQVLALLDGQFQLAALVHDLHGLAVGLLERGAQRLVPADDLGEAAAPELHVERAVHAYRRRDVVGGAARVELVEEPHALLGERCGEAPFACRWPVAVAAPQPLCQQRALLLRREAGQVDVGHAPVS